MKICAGLAVLREDGFSCLRLKEESSEGRLETVPLELPDHPAQITLNADCGDGSIVAAVADAATGDPLPGYTFADCRPIQEDGTRIVVRWAEHDRVIRQNRAVRIRIRLAGGKEGPRLFSIGV